MSYQNYEKIAIKAATQAGKKILAQFKCLKKSDIKTKSKHEIVTPSDTISEKIILNLIKKNFPDHAILSEEAGKKGAKKSDYLWIIDPLDGTTNFAIGNPLFSVSIALAKNDQIIIGVIYIPFLNQLYLARKDKGAWLNQRRITVSSQNNISHSFLTFCHGPNKTDVSTAINLYQKLKPTSRDLRQIGSAAIECSWVAQGKTEAIIIPGAKIWDIAAGTLLVKEAGGIVTDMNGRDWNLNSNGIIASNKNISQKLIKLVKKIK